MNWTKHLLLIIFLNICVAKVYCQNNIFASINQEGVANYKITKSNFYVYLSSNGQIFSYSANGNGGITYDYKGRVDKIGSTSITYDYKGRMDNLGNAAVTYDYKGRVNKIGNTSVTYDYKGRIDNINNLTVTYDYKGRIDKIGNSTITYDYKGRIDNIDDTDGIFVFRPTMEED